MNDRDRRISVPDDFNEALSKLVHEAVLRGVDVEGGWDLDDRSDRPNFTVEIYRLEDG